MLASQIRTLALMLHRKPTPDLLPTIAARLDELSDCVRAIENSPIPPHILAAAGVVALPPNVVRLADVRAVRS